MPNMNAKAAEITDPFELLDRVEYRERRMHEKLDEHLDDPRKFVSMMAGYNSADLRQLRSLISDGRE